MGGSTRSYGDLMIEGMREAVEIARGAAGPARVRRASITVREAKVAPPPKYAAARIRSIRRRLNLSQTVFAATLNVSPATVRGWERGVRVPDGPSRRLLEVVERYPEAVLASLG